MLFISFSDVFNNEIWANTEHLQDENLQRNLDRLKRTVIASRAPGTTEGYKRAFLRWKKFTLSYQHMKVLPAAPLDVALYLQAVMDDTGSASSVESAFYAINWAHSLAGVESPTTHPVVIAVRDAAVRNLGKRKENRKKPITPDHIKSLIECSNLSNLLCLRNVCVFTLAFAGFFRIEEVLNIKRNNISFIENGITILVESSKTDQLRLGDEVIISRIPGSISCPVVLLEMYLEKAKIISSSKEYLFRPISKIRVGHRLIGDNKPISYTTIREAFKESFKSIVPDISEYSTHSLRAGGLLLQLMLVYQIVFFNAMDVGSLPPLRMDMS